MDELVEPTRRVPRWLLLLFGVAFAASAVQALLSGVTETPSVHAFLRSEIERDAQPGSFWFQVLSQAAIAIALLAVARRRYASEGDELYEPDTTPPPRPRGALRVLGWLGVIGGTLLVLAGVAAHFTMDPIIGLFFVLPLCGAGLVIGLAGAGYLITGRP